MSRISKLEALCLAVAFVVLLGCFILLGIVGVCVLLSLNTMEWLILGVSLVLILILWIGIYQYDKHF
ncbi:hypothetical protein phiSHEF5_19 [Enterococcus phage phiSHEF5]|uniref:Uncharacterized protein n=1 Tax=Enterococcus phage phiSHEF5 TaxID=2030924 RepID=A0A249XUL6_9CAUD|nr:hypothetical protein FDI50_gp19 [Enterococcus phage phiSHEF5]ASZ75675.1 hypothetical protein phiSHEF5_19 [Enterococcus phage phiSHEF5]